jgi:hypothetical protein
MCEPSRRSETNKVRGGNKTGGDASTLYRRTFVKTNPVTHFLSLSKKGEVKKAPRNGIDGSSIVFGISAAMHRSYSKWKTPPQPSRSPHVFLIQVIL